MQMGFERKRAGRRGELARWATPDAPRIRSR